MSLQSASHVGIKNCRAVISFFSGDVYTQTAFKESPGSILGLSNLIRRRRRVLGGQTRTVGAEMPCASLGVNFSCSVHVKQHPSIWYWCGSLKNNRDVRFKGKINKPCFNSRRFVSKKKNHIHSQAYLLTHKEAYQPMTLQELSTLGENQLLKFKLSIRTYFKVASPVKCF